MLRIHANASTNTKKEQIWFYQFSEIRLAT